MELQECRGLGHLPFTKRRLAFGNGDRDDIAKPGTCYARYNAADKLEIGCHDVSFQDCFIRTELLLART
jgi:hypothetical protein